MRSSSAVSLGGRGVLPRVAVDVRARAPEAALALDDMVAVEGLLMAGLALSAAFLMGGVVWMVLGW